MIADTSFLVDLLRDANPRALSKARELDEAGSKVLLTSVSVFEIWQGTGSESKALNTAAELMKRMQILPLDEQSAQIAGIISARLYKKGLPIDSEDCMIAGISMASNQKLLTRNVKHFGRIEGLEIETY